MGTRNPPWTRDELILALDLYFRHPPTHIRSSHPEVKKLSKVLNSLPIHEDRPDAIRFRNENGVYTKMCNFLPLDPSYHGKGLRHGNALDEVVWKEFANEKGRLAQIASAIRNRVEIGSHTRLGISDATEPDEDEFPEGRVLYREHRARERNHRLIREAKQRALKSAGRLACQACDFVFKQTYGAVGEDYIECHHIIPVSDLKPNSKTKLADIALLCSNCHRMVHRHRPWLSVEQLKSLLQGAASARSLAAAQRM